MSCIGGRRYSCPTPDDRAKAVALASPRVPERGCSYGAIAFASRSTAQVGVPFVHVLRRTVDHRWTMDDGESSFMGRETGCERLC